MLGLHNNKIQSVSTVRRSEKEIVRHASMRCVGVTRPLDLPYVMCVNKVAVPRRLS